MRRAWARPPVWLASPGTPPCQEWTAHHLLGWHAIPVSRSRCERSTPSQATCRTLACNWHPTLAPAPAVFQFGGTRPTPERLLSLASRIVRPVPRRSKRGWSTSVPLQARRTDARQADRACDAVRARSDKALRESHSDARNRVRLVRGIVRGDPTVQAAQPTPIAQSTSSPTGGDCFLGICDPA